VTDARKISALVSITAKSSNKMSEDIEMNPRNPKVRCYVAVFPTSTLLSLRSLQNVVNWLNCRFFVCLEGERTVVLMASGGLVFWYKVCETVIARPCQCETNV